MTARELAEVRQHLLRTGAPDERLLAELHRVVRALVAGMPLPPALSPYGRWDEDVVDDLLVDWLEGRLLRDGTLLSLLDQAFTPGAFRKLAARSLYQYVLNHRRRAESQNIYKRLLGVLKGEAFVVAVHADRPAERVYARAATPDDPPFGGDERQLASAAFAAGDLPIVRYGASAKRLSPLISTPDLERFTTRVMEHLGAALTPAQVMDALGWRLPLQPPAEEAVDERVADTSALGPQEATALRAAAVTALAQLSRREVEVLLATAEGETGQATAARLDCSPATVHNDQRRIATVVGELAADDDERGAILKTIVDLVHAATRDRRPD